MTADALVPPRPKSQARLIDAENKGVPQLADCLSGLPREDHTVRWIPMGTCLAHFDCSVWLHVMRQLIFHPERNSSNILRADVLSEVTCPCSEPIFDSETAITRRILPRRPNLDTAMTQVCKIYRSKTEEEEEALVVFTPLSAKGYPTDAAEVPFYHPKTRAIAFYYKSRPDPAPPSALPDEAVLGDLYIYIVPFACDFGFNASLEHTHRLSRTTLALLETQAQHSWGSRHNYQKRVTHDTLVGREEYMDLYLTLKQKYARTVIEHWVESTDAKKHVFEDLGIAAFIILLWKETARSSGQLPTSFVDVGCGNGLLVYLLTAEGYHGFGFDLQPRKSWSVWVKLPGGADLRVISLDAPSMAAESAGLFPASSFLIGNHADELTSWLPLLATAIPNCQGFVNIPCCPFQLDGSHFGNTKHPLSLDQLASLLNRPTDSPAVQHARREFERGPPTQQSSTSTSRNVTYLRYLSHLHLQAGWHLEKEALRIPSTKNWALVGRRRVWQAPLSLPQDVVSESAAGEVREAVKREVCSLIERHGASWKARLPPGKEAAPSLH